MKQTRHKDENELRAIVHRWNEAAHRGDKQVVDQILAQDFHGVDHTGMVRDRRSEMALPYAPPRDLDLRVTEVPELSDIQVRIYGDSAVVRGRADVKAQLEGRSISSSYQWTDTFVRMAGEWICVASQCTTEDITFDHIY